jgi:hypothetical protein
MTLDIEHMIKYNVKLITTSSLICVTCHKDFDIEFHLPYIHKSIFVLYPHGNIQPRTPNTCGALLIED